MADRVNLLNAAVLSGILVVIGIFYMVLLTNVTLSDSCLDYSITGMVTGENNECSDSFKGQILPFSIWIILWGVLCFFVFLILFEHFLPKIRHMADKKTKK